MKPMPMTNSWSPASGKIAIFDRALAEVANGRGQRVSLVAPGPFHGERTIGDFVRIYEIASFHSKFNSAYRTIHPSRFLTGGGRLRENLKAEKPDLIAVNDKYTLIYLGPLIRVRLLHDFDFRPAVVGLSCERMDVNFETCFSAGAFGRAISDPTADELRNAGKGHEAARGVFRLPHGVDCRVFSPVHRSASDRRRRVNGIAFVCRPVGARKKPVIADRDQGSASFRKERVPADHGRAPACPVIRFSNTQSNTWAREELAGL